jgi:hypothetical protein
MKLFQNDIMDESSLTMRSIMICIVILIGYLSFGFFIPQYCQIDGHIKGEFVTSPSWIILKGDNHKLDSCIVIGGSFHFNSSFENIKVLDLYYVGLGTDPILIKSIRKPKNDHLVFDFQLPIEPSRNILMQVLCPKCHKTNKVYKIRHSDAPVVTRIVDQKGNIAYSPIYKGYFMAGCIGGAERFYCSRDKIMF